MVIIRFFYQSQWDLQDRGSLAYNFVLNLEPGWKQIAGWAPSLWVGLEITTLSALIESIFGRQKHLESWPEQKKKHHKNLK